MNTEWRDAVSREMCFFTGKGASKEELCSLLFSKTAVMVIGKRRQHARHRKAALMSYQCAVQESLKSVCSGCRMLLVTEVLDDATLWTRAPPDDAARDVVKLKHKFRVARRLARGSSKRTPKASSTRPTGRNLATQCLSMVQHLLAKSATGSKLMQLHCPIQPLPQANWSTLEARKARWSFWRGHALGEHFVATAPEAAPARGHSLPDIVAAVPIIVKLATGDAASANKCLMASEERASHGACIARERFRLFFYKNCVGRQVCLLTRPAYRSLADLSTIVVRTGHLLGGARNLNRFLECCDAVVKANYVHKQCLALPAEAAEWRRQNRWYLEASMASMDLGPEEIDAILDHFQALWEPMGQYVHYCVHGRCKSGCTSEQEGKERAVRMVRLALQMGLVVGLEYRWKGMDRAGGYCLRARALMDTLRRALHLMYSKKARREAEEQAAMVDDHEQLSFAVRAALKAGSVCRFLDADPANQLFVRMALITSPLQRVLNHVQLVDGLVCKHALAAQIFPSDDHTRHLRLETMKANLKVLSGHCGLEAVDAFFGLVRDFRLDRWRPLHGRGREPVLLQTACVMAKTMADAWRRLVLYYDDMKFKVLVRLCQGPLLHRYDEGAVTDQTQELDRLHFECPGCLDPFVGDFRDLLSTRPADAWAVAHEIVAHCRVASAVVERAHLHGQELRAEKGRGLAPAAKTVAEVSFRRSAVAEARSVSRLVHERVFKARGLTMARYVALSRSFRTGLRNRQPERGAATEQKRKRTVSNVDKMLNPKRRRRATDGYRSFRSSKWSCRARVGTDEFRAEEQRVKKLWEDLPDAEKTIWSGDAAARNLARDQIYADPLSSTAVASASRGELFPNERYAVSRDLFTQTTADIDGHPAWEAGLALMTPSSALSPAKVLADRSVSQAEAFVDKCFAYDEKVVGTPPRAP